MGYPLRWFLPGMVFEVTTRTIHERYLLRPSPLSRDLIVGVLARAQARFPTVNVHAFVFLSNHYHLLVSASDGQQFAAFLGYINGNVARKLGRLHRWRDRLWSRRARPIPILEPEAQVARLRYVLSNGVKEGLVKSPRHWPGASATPALLGSMSLRGRWVDQDALTRARRRDASISAAAFTTFPVLKLAPLPVFAGLSASALRKAHAALVKEIEVEHAAREVLGASRVQQQDPHDAPDASSERHQREAERFAPLCHTLDAHLRAGFRSAFRAFTAAFRACSRGPEPHLDDYPFGCFPRPFGFRIAPLSAFADLLAGLSRSG